MSKDIAVGAVGGVPQQDAKNSVDGAILAGSGYPRGAAISTKPAHLIVIEDFNGKTRVLKNFIALDKPELVNGFIQAKGIFCDFIEDEISKNFNTVLTSSPKELFLEMMFPWHKIHSIRNLAFRQK